MKRERRYQANRLGLQITVSAVLCAVAVIQAAAPGDARGGRTGRPTVAVHGHWTIDVRDADGTPTDRREFENELTPLGAFELASLLGGLQPAHVGPWAVRLFGTACGENIACNLVDARVFPNGLPTHPIAIMPNGERVYGTLSVSRAGTSSATIVLAGGFSPTGSGSIVSVATSLPVCAQAADCAAQVPSRNNFTSKTLASPIGVTNGQHVDLNVRLSFVGTVDLSE
jgi:hypothetical protein